MNTFNNEELRITIGFMWWVRHWNQMPYQDMPWAEIIEYPTITRSQLDTLLSGTPDIIEKTLAAISNLK